MKKLINEAIELLKDLISIESISKSENRTADCIEKYLNEKTIKTYRLENNVWAKNLYFDKSKPTILLNSHHDTVKPNSKYTYNPYEAITKDGKLFGLGSNDAGGSLVSLLACFLYFYDKKKLNFNLVFAASAEEEISGSNGVELVLPELGDVYFGIVGEPTKMQMAIAEKGLLVIDCKTSGIAGHAAREEGENAIYKALDDIEWFRKFQFPEISDTLGPVKMTVSMIKAGSQHNVVPDNCNFTVDIRTTDKYTNREILNIIKKNVACEVIPRSIKLNSSALNRNHLMVLCGLELGLSYYGSPTTSDQALMFFPTFKMGPGDSVRSHTADEFIYLKEIEEGIKIYIKLLNKFNLL
jgi:acetylornithine deacetylase